MPDAKRAAIYVRISKDASLEGLGVKRQTDECQALAEKLELDVVAVYEDNDQSASKGARREGYEALLAEMEARNVDVVLAWHPDRLTRRTVELERFIDIANDAEVDIQTVTAGAYDLGTPNGRMLAKMLGAVAQAEVEQKALRQKSKNRQSAEAGKAWVGRDRCYGYTHSTEPEVVPEEAGHIRDAAARILDGEPLNSVCRAITDAGSTSSRGNAWTGPALRGLLTNPMLIGKRAYDGKLYDAAWEAILTEEQHRDLVAILNNPARSTKTSARVTLLAGFLRCALCGGRMTGRNSGGRPTYVCAKRPGFPNCGRIHVSRKQADEAVRDVILNLLASSEEVSPTSEAAEAAQAVADIERRLEALEEDYYLGDLRKDRYEHFRALLLEERELRHQEYAELTMSVALRQVPLGDRTALAEAWDARGLEWQRALVDAVIHTPIRVSPATAAGRASRAKNRMAIVPKQRQHGQRGLAPAEDKQTPA